MPNELQRRSGWCGWDVEGRRWMLSPSEKAFGDYTPGRYAWLLADVRRLPEPIPARGALGLWEWEGKLKE
jgi:hypothetical protein